MKNIVPFYFRYLLAAALLVLARVSAVAVDEEYQKRVRKAATQLGALIRANAQNTLEGHPERNQYVFGDASWVQAETGLSYVGAAKIQAINAQLQEFYESTQRSNPPGITYYVYLGVRVNSSGLVFANAEGALALGEHKSLSEAEIRSKFLEEQEKFTQDVFLVSKLNTTSAILNVTGYFDYWEVNNMPKAEVSFLNVFALGDALLPFFGDIKEEIRSKGDDAKFSKDAEKALTTFVNASVGVFRARSGFVNLYETLAIGSGEKWDQAIMAMASDLDGLVQNNKPYASDFAVDHSKNPFVKHLQVRYVKTAQYFNLETSEAWNRKLAWLEYNTIKFSNTGGKRVYVVFRQIDFLIPADKYSVFANEVLAKSSQTDKNRTAVICIPFYRNTIGEILTFPAIGLGSSSVFPRDWQTNFAQSTLNQNVSQLISSAYTDLPKPYRNYYYYFRVDGRTIQLSLKSPSDVRGRAAIAELQFSYDKALTNFTAFIDEIASQRSNPHAQVAESVIRANLLALRWANTGVNQVTPKLLEEYTDLHHQSYVHSYLKEVYGKYFNLELPGGFVPAAALVDQTDPVLALLDYYSLILTPTGFDFVPELAGGIYCAVQGEGVQASIYFASVVLAGVNSATLRKFIEGAEFIVKDGRLTLRPDALDLVRVTNTATTLSDEVVAALNGLEVNKTDGIVDLVVHAEGSKFFAYVEDATGTLGQRVELTSDHLATFVEHLALAGNAPVRLLSCNNLEAARALSQVLPERTIIATDGLVRVHGDRGITVVARAENSDVAWYEFKNGVRSATPLATPPVPGVAHLDDFVQMGSTENLVERVNGILNKVDGIYLTSKEKEIIAKFHTLQNNLTDVEFIRKYRTLKQILPDIQRVINFSAVQHDIVRLEKLINTVDGDLTKLHVFWEAGSTMGNGGKVAGDYANFKRIVDYIDLFKKQNIGPEKPRYFAKNNKLFDDINMMHILDKHTVEHFNFSRYNLTGNGDIHFFGIGTTSQQICDYIDEALEWLSLNKGPGHPINGAPELVTLSNGMQVKIGSDLGNEIFYQPNIPFAGTDNIIGQFYPQGSVGVTIIKIGDLNALKYILQ